MIKRTSKIILFIIWFALMMLLFMSCATWNQCAKKFGTGETHYVTVRDTIPYAFEVVTEGDSLEGGIDMESLLLDSIYNLSSAKDLSIKLWYDKYQKAIRYKAKVKVDTITVKEFVPVEVRAECPDAVVADPEQALSWRAKVWKDFQFFAAWLVLALGVVLIGRKLVV